MADDFKDDPEYQQTRRGMLFSHIRTFVWGVAGTACIWGAIAVAAPGILAISGAVALGAAALFCMYKGYNAAVDERAGYSEIAAERAKQHFSQAKAPQHSQEMSAPSPTPVNYKDNWQQEMATKAAMLAQTTNNGRSA